MIWPTFCRRFLAISFFLLMMILFNDAYIPFSIPISHIKTVKTRVLYRIIFIIWELCHICHRLGLGHETMVCVVCKKKKTSLSGYYFNWHWHKLSMIWRIMHALPWITILRSLVRRFAKINWLKSVAGLTGVIRIVSSNLVEIDIWLRHIGTMSQCRGLLRSVLIMGDPCPCWWSAWDRSRWMTWVIHIFGKGTTCLPFQSPFCE